MTKTTLTSMNADQQTELEALNSIYNSDELELSPDGLGLSIKVNADDYPAIPEKEKRT